MKKKINTYAHVIIYVHQKKNKKKINTYAHVKIYVHKKKQKKKSILMHMLIYMYTK